MIGRKLKSLVSALLLVSAILFLAPAYSAGATAIFSGPSGIPPGDKGQYRVEITPEAPLSGFDIAVLVPSGWTISSDWQTVGYPSAGVALEKRSRSYKGLSYEAYHWKFPSALSSKMTFSFSLSVPRTESLGKTREISAIWTTPESFGTKNLNVTVGDAGPSCGDSSCSIGETCSSCPVDCGVCWGITCGDSVCSEGENNSNCPKDCVASPGTTTTKPSGWEIVITPETGSLLYTIGLALGGIILLVLLVLLIILLVKGRPKDNVSALETAKKEIKSPLAHEREEALATIAALEKSASEGPTLKDQIKGKVEIRPVEKKPQKARVEKPPVDTVEKKISALKKAMFKIENIMDDIGKDL